jgi:hypothetical protein
MTIDVCKIMAFEKGKTYKVRLKSGPWVPAEFLSQETWGGIDMTSRALGGLTRHIRKRHTYHFRSLKSGRTITLRSLQRVKQIEGGALPGDSSGLMTAAAAAVHALRSYQYGNSSPELAEEVADALEAAIKKADLV